MYSISDFLKQIRKEGSLTQPELAKALGVSTVLISMIETKQKNVSKSFLQKLAKGLKVHPGTLAPFFFSEEISNPNDLSPLERKLLDLGSELQRKLIETKAKNLKNNEEYTLSNY